MLRLAPAAALILLAACGGNSEEDKLREAADQSDPAAAAVLENAADNGMSAQDAMDQAGAAQARADGAGDTTPNAVPQARPNLPQSPNRPSGGQPPAKVTVPANETVNVHSNEHEGH